MTKPTVYLDTTIISAYCYAGSDVLGLARRMKTRSWWDEESDEFAIWVSGVTEDELSWNYAHLANPLVQERLERICQKYELRSPVLVSPETIPKTGLGQTIRRRQP